MARSVVVIPAMVSGAGVQSRLSPVTLKTDPSHHPHMPYSAHAEYGSKMSWCVEVRVQRLGRRHTPIAAGVPYRGRRCGLKMVRGHPLTSWWRGPFEAVP